MGVMCLPNGQGFSNFLTHDMGKFEKNLGPSRKNICTPFFSHVEPCLELFSRVGWGGFGRLKMKHGEWVGLSMVPKDRVGRVVTMAADSPWKYAMKHAVFLTGLTSEGPSCKKTSSRYEI